MQYKITWLGAIAQAYMGDYEFKRELTALMAAVEFPTLPSGNA